MSSPVTIKTIEEIEQDAITYAKETISGVPGPFTKNECRVGAAIAHRRGYLEGYLEACQQFGDVLDADGTKPSERGLAFGRAVMLRNCLGKDPTSFAPALEKEFGDDPHSAD